MLMGMSCPFCFGKRNPFGRRIQTSSVSAVQVQHVKEWHNGRFCFWSSNVQMHISAVDIFIVEAADFSNTKTGGMFG